MINKIVIVGGGSSGWISAAFLKKTFPDKEIVVIESPNIPTIGVGESTLADITNFRDYLQIDEREFMKATNASYKMSIKFTDFYDKDTPGFHYPFRKPDLSGTKRGLTDWLEIKAFYPNTPVQDFIRCYFPHAALLERKKYSGNSSGVFGNWVPKEDVAYHFDAVLFGIWLKEKYCLSLGVKLIQSEVKDAVTSDAGIEHLVLSDNSTVTADLYIDCTGFNSILLGGYLKEPFIPYDHILPNNRAWAVQIPYKDKEKELEPYTHCTAIENGWVWNVPLWSRIGTGYVYSDKYVSKEDALNEFKKHLMSQKMICPRSSEELDSLKFRDIPMKVGIHKRTWVKNVVAIGLSAGFIEPLEGNGLFSTFWFIAKLAKSLQRKEVSKLDRDIYNYSVHGMYDSFVEFVALHYGLSVRRDTEYWRSISERTFSSNIAENKPTNISGGIYDLQQSKMFTGVSSAVAGITYISVGMNYPVFDAIDQKMNVFDYNIKPYIDENVRLFEEKKRKWNAAADKASSLCKYLEDNIYGK